MKILQLCKKFPYPDKDGEAIAILNLTKAFNSAGHRVTVLAINTKKHYFNLRNLPESLQSIATFDAVTLDTSIKWKDALMNLYSKRSYNIERFNSIQFKARLITLLNKSSFDIIQLEGLYLLSYMDTIRKYSKARVILRAHNVEHEIWQRMTIQKRNPFKRWYFQLLTNRLKKFELENLNSCDALVPISKRDANRFRSLGCNSPIYVLPAGIEQDLLEMEVNQEAKTSLFFIGGLDWIPNREGINWFLNHVWPDIYKKFPDFEFYIAGRNIPDNMLHLNIPGVQIVGEVDDAKTFMLAHQMMLVPLFAGSGMRIKILEALALKRSIISTSIGAEGINFQDGKELLIADDKEMFLKQIEKCLNQPHLMKELGENGHRLIVEQYDNNQLAAGLLTFYKSLLN